MRSRALVGQSHRARSDRKTSVARVIRNTPTLLVAAMFGGMVSMSAVSAGSPADAENIARNYLQKNQRNLGLDAADLRELTISANVPGSAQGMRHVYLQQNARGIPVWNALFTVNVAGDGSVINPGNRFFNRLAARTAGQSVRRNPVQAAQSAAGFLDLRLKQPIRATANRGGPAQKHTLSTGGVALRPIEAELVWYYAQDIKQLRLSWRVQIESSSTHHWDVFVDAVNGEPLAAKDRVIHETYSSIAAATANANAGPGAMALLNGAGALVAASPESPPSFPNIDGSTYTVYPFPFESPSDGGRRSVSGAASPAASPFGWHDTNGVAGAEYTVTRGNNVRAYSDVDNNDQPDANSEPEGGASLTFSVPTQAGVDPYLNKDAAVVNLFYWNNIVHDITYGYGFNEASGNFQTNNYGKGGLDDDAVRAEALDGSGTDNANFSTGVDGQAPRMQMYRWNFPFPNVVNVSAPALAVGSYIATAAGFGTLFPDSGPKVGSLVLANDGTGTTSDGCEALVAFPAGAIAMMDRGSCNFTIKVKNAQNASASAVVMVNNIAGDPIAMGGTDATVTIPSAMISLADGNKLKSYLPATATVQANGSPPPAHDSDLDAGVIVHEYGHGISNRLTGGPNVGSCLANAEQMGEGWSDWFAATFTARTSDVGSTRRGMASYLYFQPITGTGLRNTPYSTDVAINPSNYASVANAATISSPHGIGYVWNSMLWEVYWNLVHRYGFNPNLYQAWNTGGNNLAVQLVMDGMKMQPCSPGFVDGRNAILAADTALTGGANTCEIWRGFAKRGLGVSASQGSSNDRADGAQAFDLPAACSVATFGGFQSPITAAPALNPVLVPTTQAIALQFSVTGLTGPLIIDTQQVNCATLEPTSAAPIALSSALGLQKSGNNYAIDWRPAKSWAGTCRAVTLRIPAASNPVAYFRFDEAVPQKVNR